MKIIRNARRHLYWVVLVAFACVCWELFQGQTPVHAATTYYGQSFDPLKSWSKVTVPNASIRMDSDYSFIPNFIDGVTSMKIIGSGTHWGASTSPYSNDSINLNYSWSTDDLISEAFLASFPYRRRQTWPPLEIWPRKQRHPWWPNGFESIQLPDSKHKGLNLCHDQPKPVDVDMVCGQMNDQFVGVARNTASSVKQGQPQAIDRHPGIFRNEELFEYLDQVVGRTTDQCSGRIVDKTWAICLIKSETVLQFFDVVFDITTALIKREESLRFSCFKISHDKGVIPKG